MLADLRFRLRALFRRGAVERELHDELRFHLDREIEKHVRTGMARADAERKARIAFGGVERIKDDARDARGVALVDDLRQDLRYALRGLRSRPGFAAAVVVTLGLGIGANAAMFGIVDRLLVRPPAYLADAERTHRVYLRYFTDLEERIDRNIEYTRYDDLVRWTTSFDKMAAFGYPTLAVGTGDAAREMTIGAVSASLFVFFEVRPALGRFFRADEDRTPTGSTVVVLSYDFWQSRYAGDPAALGTSLHIGTLPYTIIGVAPAGFVGVTEGRAPAAFIPITSYAHARNPRYFESYAWSWLEIIVHRRPGVSVATADADLTNAFLRSWNAESQRNPGPLPAVAMARPRGHVASIHMGRGPQASRESRVVTWVSGVAGIVLLIACANVGNLLLARALGRRREIALRLALGVTRERLLRQLLTESALLAVLGGLSGLLAAQWGAGALRSLFLRAEDARAVLTDWRTVAFAAVVTMLVALLTGLAPALHTLNTDVSGAMKAGAREGTYRRSHLRAGLLLFQAALSVVLLIGAGLFVRSLDNVRSMRMGYDIRPVLYAEGNLRGARLSAGERAALADRLLAAARSTPGVTSATLNASVPFWSNEGRGAPMVPGVDSTGRLGRFLLQAGSPSYFETMGTRILRGRGFTDRDGAASERVLLVTESMARVLWPGQDPIGKQLKFFDPRPDTVPYTTVIGVVEDMSARLLADDREFWYFMPMAQYLAFYGNADPTLFARVSGNAADQVEVLRRRLQREMPGAAYVNVMPLENLVSPLRRTWRFGATMFVVFGALALVLAAIGLYSVIAYAVAQRTQELGVRIALGASVGDVIRMIVRQGVSFALAGIAIGSLLALWAARWVEPLLFRQSGRDPLVFVTVAAVLLAVAVAATLRPAMRATRVDPTAALRSD